MNVQFGDPISDSERGSLNDIKTGRDAGAVRRRLVDPGFRSTNFFDMAIDNLSYLWHHIIV